MRSVSKTIMMMILGLVTAGAYASVSYSGGTYTQNFDSLASTGTGITFTDDSTLAGWYAVSANTQVVYTNGVSFSFFVPITQTTRADAYNTGPGGSSGTTLYSFGSLDASDRALGSISDQSHDFFHGLCIQNNTGSSLSDFTLTYDGEQWRDSGSDFTQDMLVFYRIGGTEFDSSGTWTQLNDLTFTSPTLTDSGAVDGDSAANRVAGLTQTVTASVANGENIWFAWVDLDYEAEADHGLAIDNVNFTATIPEPGTVSLVMLSAGAIAIIRRLQK